MGERDERGIDFVDERGDDWAESMDRVVGQSMRKAAFARILMAVALLTSGWSLMIGTIAPFGAVGFGSLVVLVTAGVTSFAAVIVAVRHPRQFVVLGISGLLSLGHAVIWSWIALISFAGGI